MFVRDYGGWETKICPLQSEVRKVGSAGEERKTGWKIGAGSTDDLHCVARPKGEVVNQGVRLNDGPDEGRKERGI